jgi:hypothetical protein
MTKVEICNSPDTASIARERPCSPRGSSGKECRTSWEEVAGCEAHGTSYEFIITERGTVNVPDNTGIVA